MPLENPSTYPKVDPNGHLSADSVRSTFSGLTRFEVAYRAKDFGAGFFDATAGTLTFLFESQINSAGNAGMCEILALANDLNDRRGQLTGNKNQVGVRSFRSGAGALGIDLEDITGGGRTADTWLGPSVLTPYYYTFVLTAVTATLFIHSDSARTIGNLLDTLVIALSADRDWRYLYLAQSDNQLSPIEIDGWSQNYDLNLVGANGRRRRMLIGGN